VDRVHIEIIPGQVFRMLTVVKEDSKRNGNRYVICTCECGNRVSIPVGSLRHRKSCGCAKGRHVHGKYYTSEYAVWSSIKQRCCNSNAARYYDYGGRGVTICDEWRYSFQSFYDHIGPRPGLDYTIDRIDNNGNYEPGNVRWTTRTAQNRNRRDNIVLTFKGKKQCVTAWAEETGISRETIRDRLGRGWSVNRTLSTPVRAGRWQSRRMR